MFKRLNQSFSHDYTSKLILRAIYIVLLCLLALAIPIYQTGILSLFILLLSILSILRINPNRKVAWGTIFLSGLLIFILQAISLFWSEDLGTGLKNLETKLSLLLLPIIFGSSEPLSKKDYSYIKLSFLAGITLSMVIHLSRAISRTVSLEDLSAFYYVELAWVFHPTYLSMYIVSGVAMLLFDQNTSISEGKFKWVRMFFIVLSVLFLTLLSSKAGLLSLFLVLMVFIIHGIYSKKPFISKALGIVSLSILLAMVVFNPIARKRVNSAAISDQTLEIDVNNPIESTVRNTTAVRLKAWQISLDIMNEAPFGKGIGDGKQALLDSYEEQKEYYMLDRKFNAHNQFFEMGLSNGWLGLLVLVFCLLVLFIRAVYLKDLVMLVVLIIIGVNLLTESAFERQSGAVFIPFIISLLAFREASKPEILSR